MGHFLGTVLFKRKVWDDDDDDDKGRKEGRGLVKISWREIRVDFTLNKSFFCLVGGYRVE